MNSADSPRGFLAKRNPPWMGGCVRSGGAAWLAVLMWVWLWGFALAATAAQLTIADGVVVKFGAGAGMVARDTLRVGRSVVFTSLADDGVGGQSQPGAGIPKAGDWAGVILDPAAAPAKVTLDGLSLRYAGGAGGAALSFQHHDYVVSELIVRDSLVGIRAAAGGAAQLTGLSLMGNGIGLQALGGATPTLTGSDLHGNTQFGVHNQNPTTPVLATGNWWGAASGPTDPAGNPAGQGDRVSAGVDYGQFRTAPPLLGCTVAPRDGYTTRVATITLLLACANATDYRLSERSDLDDATFAPMTASVAFTLSATPGEKTVYAEYRGVEGETRIVQTLSPIHYAPAGPQIAIIAPPAGAIIGADTLIQAQASDEQGLARVEFWIDATRLATVTAPPYQTWWVLGAIANGPRTIKAIATNTRQQSTTAQVTVTVQRQDSDGPTLELLFNGVPLVPGATVTTPGAVTVKASDPNGVRTLALLFDGQPLATLDTGNTPTATGSRTFDFAGIPNGDHTIAVTATDGSGNSRALNIPFTLELAPPAAPRITAPADGATVQQATLTVSGTAQAGSQVQLYLDGTAAGPLWAVAASGGFSGTITLPAEGSHTLQADARNARGTGPRGEAITIQYNLAAPTVAFVAPAPGAILTVATEFRVSALDASGIAEVALSVDGQPLARLTEPPYQYRWDIAGVAEGVHVWRAVATAGSGKTAQAELAVTVQKTPPPPPPTAYTGKVLAIEPAVSHGPQPITITGQAVDRAGQPVADAALRLVLQVGGFQRRIALASDGTGAFRYVFIPQPSDAGVYQVSVVHPDETTLPDQGHFTINRIRFNLSQYGFIAARGFPTPITVTATASAGTGVTGLRWEARPADQPSGALPPGIQIDGGAGIDLAPSASAPLTIQFKAEAGTAQESGSVFLVAVARDSGSSVRGTLRLDYQLAEARPVLFAEPTYLELGVRRDTTASGKIGIGNRGLVAATGVTARLLADGGGAPPSWLFLASTEALGTLEVGQTQTVQITATPGATVVDGVYAARLRIEAANATGGDVPVSVSVTQQGEGRARFHVADIFTDTPDGQGRPIPGVAGASISVQNEAVTSVQGRAVTDDQGVATFDSLPPGAYRYRVSAPHHTDASGRLQLQPGVTTSQAVFLDYALISVSFSVTETTLQDRYDLTLTATYLTQVPAPVVLMEPLAVNLPDLQVGESLTGELVITNYGLVRADHVAFSPPPSDASYQYEFLSAVPETLPAKARITVPYRITARAPPAPAMAPTAQEPVMGALGDPRYAQGLRQALAQPLDGAACTRYGTLASLRYDFSCANGEVRPGGASTVFSYLEGGGCGGASGGGGYYRPPGCLGELCGNGGGFGSGGGPSPGAMPLTPSCTPDCPPHSICCANNGSGPGGGGPNGPGGPGGPLGGNTALGGGGSGGGSGASP